MGRQGGRLWCAGPRRRLCHRAERLLHRSGGPAALRGPRVADRTGIPRMTERRLYLDVGVGETRGVVTLDGRPERLLISRDGDLACQALGAEVVGRVRKVERQLALAFVDLGDGPDGVLNLRPDIDRLVE